MTDLQRLVLVVEDDALIALGMMEQMEDLGLSVCGPASTAQEAIDLAQLHRPLLVLMDMRLDGEEDGVDAAMAIHATVGSKVIFITGSRDPATISRIQLDHPCAVLIKPVSELQLRRAIQEAIGEIPGPG